MIEAGVWFNTESFQTHIRVEQISHSRVLKGAMEA